MTGTLMAWKKLAGIGCLVAGTIALAGPAWAEETVHDPHEGFNRAMFAVNEGLDTVLVKPVAQAYDFAVPLPAKASVGSFFGNIADIRNVLNNALQGKVADAGSDLGRLLINSTVGILGLFDVASEMGMPKHEEDFGQTLAVWGVGDGPYVFLPIIGPRTTRDTFGWMVDEAVDPVWWGIDNMAVRNSAAALRFVDIRASLLPADKVVEEAALDKYAYIRDAYLQRRRSQIFDGRPPKQDE